MGGLRLSIADALGATEMSHGGTGRATVLSGGGRRLRGHCRCRRSRAVATGVAEPSLRRTRRLLFRAVGGEVRVVLRAPTRRVPRGGRVQTELDAIEAIHGRGVKVIKY